MYKKNESDKTFNTNILANSLQLCNSNLEKNTTFFTTLLPPNFQLADSFSYSNNNSEIFINFRVFIVVI